MHALLTHSALQVAQHRILAADSPSSPATPGVKVLEIKRGCRVAGPKLGPLCHLPWAPSEQLLISAHRVKLELVRVLVGAVLPSHECKGGAADCKAADRGEGGIVQVS